MNTPETTPIFQTCRNASKLIGVAESTLRRWCSEGMVPHIKSGNVYLVNIPLLMQLLNDESRKSCGMAADLAHLDVLP